MRRSRNAILLTLPVLPILGSAGAAHPHDPKALKVELKGGVTVTLNHITVPYNGEHLKSITPGFVWHCGFARVKTPAALSAGGKEVPAGEYMVQVKNLAEGRWSYLLIPPEHATLKRRLERAERRLIDALGGEREEIEEEIASLRSRVEKTSPVEFPAALSEENRTEEHLLIELVPGAAPSSGERPDSFQVRLRWGNLQALGDLKLARPPSPPSGGG